MLIFLNVMKYFDGNNKSLGKFIFGPIYGIHRTGSFIVFEQKQKRKQPHEGTPGR